MCQPAAQFHVLRPHFVGILITQAGRASKREGGGVTGRASHRSLENTHSQKTLGQKSECKNMDDKQCDINKYKKKKQNYISSLSIFAKTWPNMTSRPPLEKKQNKSKSDLPTKNNYRTWTSLNIGGGTQLLNLLHSHCQLALQGLRCPEFVRHLSDLKATGTIDRSGFMMWRNMQMFMRAAWS